MRRTRKLVQPPSGGRSETPEPGLGNEIEVFIKIGLRSRATAPGPTCSASGSLIRARHRVRRGGVPSRWDGPGSSSIRLLAEGKRLRSRENGSEMVFIKQRARTASVKTSGSAVPPAGRAYRSLIWARGWVRRGGNLFMNIWLCSRATAPGPTCSASGSLIRARHRVRRGGVPPIGRAYRSLLSTASDGTDSEAPSQWDGPGSSSNRLLAEGKRLRSREMEVKWSL